MGLTAAVGVGLAASAASTYASVKNSQAQQEQAKTLATQQMAQTKDLQDQATQKTAADQAAAQQIQQTAVAQQKARAAQSQGTFGGTLLTGPLGITGNQSGSAPKTLLGS